jgi:hypothetical protein
VILLGKNMQYRVLKTYNEFSEIEKFLIEEFDEEKHPKIYRKIPRLDKNIVSTSKMFTQNGNLNNSS